MNLHHLSTFVRFNIRTQHICYIKNSFKAKIITRHCSYKRISINPIFADMSTAKKGNKEKLPLKISHIHLAVLGSGKSGTTKSLFVDMNNMKYLFNCGEGTQRILNERKLKLFQTKTVFITDLSWRNLGGFVGFCLTLQNGFETNIPVFGPRNIGNFLEVNRNSAQLDLANLNVVFREALKASITDEAMTIDFYPICAEKNTEPEAKKIKLSSSEDGSGQAEMTTAYVCKPHHPPRKMDVSKFVEYKIPKDKIKNILQGETFQSPTGKMLRYDRQKMNELETKRSMQAQLRPSQSTTSPSQEVSASQGTPAFPDLGTSDNEFEVVDCPREGFITPLIESGLHKSHMVSLDPMPELKDKNLEVKVEEGTESAEEEFSVPLSDKLKVEPGDAEYVIDIVVHFSPSHIIRNERYQQWMKIFGPEVKHMLLNNMGSDVVLRGPVAMQSKLNHLHPDIFPLLPQQLQQSKVIDRELEAENVRIAEPGLTYTIRGSKLIKEGEYREDFIDFNGEEFVADLKEYLENEKFQEELKKLKTCLQNIDTKKVQKDVRVYPEVVFLGTGSCLPSTYRNVSAILVHLSEDACMILDCGEDTYGQLYRHYGDKTGSVLSKLKAVFISHLHADHFLGLASLVYERKAYLERQGKYCKPLLVIAPGRLKYMITNIQENNIPLSKLIRHIHAESFIRDHERYEHHQTEVQQCLGISNIETCRVYHRMHPHGVKVTLSDGYTLVYSGDTMPCDYLEELGEGCDLLIHEATMADELIEDANFKNHSVTSEAIQSGIRMNAGFILLTHFSQRYSKIPLFNNEFNDKVGIAFDNMRVRPCDLHLLPLFIPALKELFWEEYADMQDFHEKQVYKIERIKREKEKQAERIKKEKEKEAAEFKEGKEKGVAELKEGSKQEGTVENSSPKAKKKGSQKGTREKLSPKAEKEGSSENTLNKCPKQKNTKNKKESLECVTESETLKQESENFVTVKEKSEEMEVVTDRIVNDEEMSNNSDTDNVVNSDNLVTTTTEDCSTERSIESS